MEIRSRNYLAEESGLLLPRIYVGTHPLAISQGVSRGQSPPGSVTSARRSSSSKTSEDPCETLIDDPLGALSIKDPLRELSNKDEPAVRATSSKTSRRGVKGGLEQQAEAAAVKWDARKATLLQRFTSSGTITVSASFDIVSSEPKGRGRSITAARLEELEDPEKEARTEVKIISQHEYVQRLRELNDEIAQAWLHHERVTALRLAIKVAKLLTDTSVPQFYPTLFVLVTDVMDTVGQLVWDRIKEKAEMDDSGNPLTPLPVNFTSRDVRPEAKDTCYNWFYKIGSIRELLPRVYLEMAIVRCIHFLEPSPPVATFHRLSAMLRGVADPLAAAYARLYLARRGLACMPLNSGEPTRGDDALRQYSEQLVHVGQAVPSSFRANPRGYLLLMLEDYMRVYRRVLGGELNKGISSTGIDRGLYLQLVEPAIEYMIQALLQEASMDVMMQVADRLSRPAVPLRVGSTGQGLTGAPVAVLLYYLLKELPSSVVATLGLKLTRLIRSTEDASMRQYMSYRLLGAKLCECPPPGEDRLPILNETWKVVAKYTNLMEYLSVADVFVEYILKLFTEVELRVLLKDLAQRLSKAPPAEPDLTILESIVFKLVSHYEDLTTVLSLAHFVSILDAFSGDVRISVYKRILSVVAKGKRRIRDAVTVNFLTDLAKVLHDWLDILSGEDDRRQITRLITRFVQQVDFGKDMDGHLNFLVDCRAVFPNMDAVRGTVVLAANGLAVAALRAAKGELTPRTIDFVKACVAFSEVTIPSIAGVLPRLHLFLETAQVALLNGLPGHAEALVKGAITCLQEAQNGDAVAVAELKTADGEEALVTFLQKTASFLVVMPGHPEHGPFYLLDGLLKVLNGHLWVPPGFGKVQVLCVILSMCAALAQEKLPYHVDNSQVESNDWLYCGEEAYQEELALLTRTLLRQAVEVLEKAPSTALRGMRALDVCNTIIVVFEENQDARAHCELLVNWASKSLPSKDPYLTRTRQLCSVWCANH